MLRAEYCVLNGEITMKNVLIGRSFLREKSFAGGRVFPFTPLTFLYFFAKI